MEAINLVIGVVLFVVVLIVLVANTQRVSDLKKSIKTASAVPPPSASQGIVVRDKNGNYAPKHPYYVRLIKTTTSTVAAALPTLPTDSGVVDQILIRLDRGQDNDGWKIADDYEKKRCVVFYRPEKRILYTVHSAHVWVDDGTTWQPVTPGSTELINSSTAGLILLNLKKNSGSGTDKMFADAEIQNDSDGSDTFEVVRRTIVGVPGGMPGNSVSGV